MSFYPDNYDETLAKNTGGGGYMKFKPGDNRFRILSKPLIGSVLWITEDGSRKPLRFRATESIPTEQVQDSLPKFFNTFVVYNYQTQEIEILEITQKGILSTLRSLDKDEDWGDLRTYDLVVKRQGEDLQTSYEVVPKPKAKLTEEIKNKYQDKKINLEALFDGADPFNTEPPMQDVDIDSIPF